MEPFVIVIAAIAATGILLVAVGLAGTLDAAAANARISRYVRRTAATSARTAQPEASGGATAGSEALASLNRAVENLDFGARLARDLARADVSLRTGEYLMLWAVSVVGVPVIFLALSFILPTLRSPFALIVAAVLGVAIPRLWLDRRKKARLQAFNKQLPDTILVIAGTLRSGSSILQAVDAVVRDSDPPISEEFRRMIREINLGLSLEAALDNVVRRIESDDLHLMATAMSIHYAVGGNLAEILDTIAFTIRERVRIQGEIRALTAQQRLSGLVVGLLPIVLVAIILVVAPSYLAPMLSNPPGILGVPAGLVAMAFGGLLMLVGFVWVRRVVDIRV